MSSLPALSFSLIAGFMACLLYIAGLYLEKNKKKSTIILIIASIFLWASFTGLEWGFWIEGQNMFELFFYPIVPLIFYFMVWCGFLIWVFEGRGQRKIWVVMLIIAAILVFIAINCMNCIHFS